MSQSKIARPRKRQTGQYMTPNWLAKSIVATVPVSQYRRILEPSCGDGAFLNAVADHLIEDGAVLGDVQGHTDLVGIEADPWLAEQSRSSMRRKCEERKGLFRAEVHTEDFFVEYMRGFFPLACPSDGPALAKESFDLIIGNPPFGGTFDRSMEDTLDKILGKRLGKKIKKETYAFFIVACMDLLRPGGRLVFICSNSLLTIATMTGLRNFLMESGEVAIREMGHFSNETKYPVMVLDFVKGAKSPYITRDDQHIGVNTIHSTPNMSWGITEHLSPMFNGAFLGDYFVASSGMTTGNNKLFVRKVSDDDVIVEPYRFEFYDAPITLKDEINKARLGKVSIQRQRYLMDLEMRHETERRVNAVLRDNSEIIQMPDARYAPYNIAINALIYSKPSHYIFWQDDGDVVITYKKTGNWYLRGIGGQQYFGTEGLTWPLVASKFNVRYLPSGYILDSGSPCAFLKAGVSHDEIFFVLGWLLSPLANRILKTVVNHTRNIQGKDFERMPYPWWVSAPNRSRVIDMVTSMIKQSESGKVWNWDDDQIKLVGKLFHYKDYYE